MKNRLITIGYLGIKRAYLNLSRDEAFVRFMKSEPGYFLTDDLTPKEIEAYLVKSDIPVYEFEFTDEFNVYEAFE